MIPLIVAELGASHNGSFDRAMALVEAAAKAGADAIKTQCFDPLQMADPGVMIESGPWAGRELLDLYKETATPMDWHEPLFKRARELGMDGFASVFHVDDVDRMEAIDCPRYKISSFELLDLPLILHAAYTDKPLIISTGMGSYTEIRNAVKVARAGGCSDITLLKCSSSYPAPVEELNLTEMRSLPGDKYGLSDHTLTLGAAAAAAALGASMIERHLTLSRADGGHDALFSTEPSEFKAMVQLCREAAAAIGEVRYGPTESEMSSLPLRRKPGGKRGG